MGEMARKLTDMQADFVRRVVAGFEPTPAARDAGFGSPAVQAYRLMRNPKVLQAIRERRQAAIEGNMATVALRTMSELMTDDTVPAATRYKASEWTLRAAGLGGDQAGDDGHQRKELEDMNAEELAQAVQSGMSALSELARSLDGRHYVDGEFREVQHVEAIEAEPAEPADTAADWMD